MSADPSPPALPSRIASLAEVSTYSGYAERTVRGWLSRGLLIAYTSPGQRGIYFDLTEVDRILANKPAQERRPYGPKAVVRQLPEDFDVAAAR